MKIIPNNRGGEREGKGGKSIPDLGSHGARGKVNVRLKRAKLSPKDTPTLVMCSQSITAGAELVTVPCACHSPSATAMARPQPSPTLSRAKLVLGETFTGFWQDLNLVLSENNHQHCCRDTQFAQQQLQPDKLLPVCPTQFPQKSLSLVTLRNQNSHSQPSVSLLVTQISSF